MNPRFKHLFETGVNRRKHTLKMYPALSVAEDAAVSEMTYILNSFSFLVMGSLMMWMAAGFAMLEADEK